MSEKKYSSEESSSSLEGKEIDLVELILLLWSRKGFLVIFSGLITLSVIVHQYFFAKEVFRSDARILPISSSSSSGMLGQLGGLANFVGLDSPKEENVTEIVLKSRTLAEKVVLEFKLNDHWQCSQQDAIRRVQAESLQITSSKADPLVTISWDDESPERAYEIVSKVIDLAQQEMSKHTNQKNGLKVSFLEARVSDAKQRLLSSENALRQFQEEYESVEIDRQAESLIHQINLLKVERQEKEIELEVTKKVLNPRSNEVISLDMRVNELQEKIDELIGAEKVNGDNKLGSDMDERTLMEIPKIGLIYARKLRDIKVAQKIYEILLEQLEKAKIESEKGYEGFQVIDQPMVPERKVKPTRSVNVIIGFIASIVFSIFVVLIEHAYGSIREKAKLA